MQTKIARMHMVMKQTLFSIATANGTWIEEYLLAPLSCVIRFQTDEGTYTLEKVIDIPVTDNSRSVVSTYKLTHEDPKGSADVHAMAIHGEANDREAKILEMQNPHVLGIRPFDEKDQERMEFLHELVRANFDVADSTNNTRYFVRKVC